MNSSVYIDNKKHLTLGEGQIQALDDAILIGEAKYFISFTQSNRKFCLSLHYNGSKSFLFVNATKIYQFKTRDFEIKIYPLFLVNISKD